MDGKNTEDSGIITKKKVFFTGNGILLKLLTTRSLNYFVTIRV
jgi:hypothetical protein